MRWAKIIFILLVLALQLLGIGTKAALAAGPQPFAPPKPEWWAGFTPYRWEHVIDQKGDHWLAVWGEIQCYDQHYTPGDWQTCDSGYGCISNWTWWLQTPESKLGVPSTWRSIWPGAQDLNNYTATCYFN
jgi:hypothetical protein